MEIAIAPGNCVRLVRGVPEFAWRVWADNRPLDNDRVSALCAYHEGHRGPDGAYDLTSNFIVFCRVGVDTYLIDGQHRLAAIGRLAEPARAVWVARLVTAASVEAAEELFRQVNCGEPLPAQYYDRLIRATLDRFVTLLAREFPGVISAAERPQRPRLNAAALRDAMSQVREVADAIRDRRLDARRLMEAARTANAHEKAIYDHAAGQAGVPARCLLAARDTGFYLGLRKGWYLNLHTFPEDDAE